LVERTVRHSGQSVTQEAVDATNLVELTEATVVEKSDRLTVVLKSSPFYNQVGVVKSASKDNKKIELIFGQIVARFKRDEVQLVVGGAPESAATVGSKISKRAQEAIEEAGATSGGGRAMTKKKKPVKSMRLDGNTLDLLGENGEDAVRACEDYFSRAIGSGRDCVYLMHGHGTGALKKRLRSWLSDEKRAHAGVVLEFGAADEGDGGDAFTYVVLK